MSTGQRAGGSRPWALARLQGMDDTEIPEDLRWVARALRDLALVKIPLLDEDPTWIMLSALQSTSPPEWGA